METPTVALSLRLHPPVSPAHSQPPPAVPFLCSSVDMASVRPFVHQVAGHGLRSTDGLLSCTANGGQPCVLKPLSSALKGFVEVSFYRHVTQQQHNSNQPLLRFLPAYHGVALLAPPSFAALTGIRSSSRPYLVLSELTACYRRPCVLDVKVGTRTFDECADARKQAEELAKYPLQAAFGFRIAGWKRWLAADGGGWDERDKRWGRAVQPHQMLLALGQFVGAASGPLVDVRLRRVVFDLLTQLRQLHAVFEQQTDYRLYASSLLLMYEGDEEAPSASTSARVWMVDFGHVFGPHRLHWLSEQAVAHMPTPLIAHWHDSLASDSIRQQQRPDGTGSTASGVEAKVAVDASYLFGLSSLISLLDALLS